ncbi:uncharacterized protein METZ01_LOCUS270571, partial [marine metagenome]
HADVAEHTGYRILPGPPGEERESGGVGKGPHVTLVYPSESFYRGSVEPYSLLYGILQILHRDGEAFQVTQDIGEPQPDEFYVVLLGATQHEITLGCPVLNHDIPPKLTAD